jgi:hypothetical protein
MAVSQRRPGAADTQTGGGRPRQALFGAAGGLALAIVLWGGYSHHWPWTGINGGTATLWDWLHLLMLPLAFAVLPIWFRRDTRVARATKAYGLAVLAVFAVIVILGYAIPLSWTGFRGNTFWDWLKLVVLPLTLVLAPRLLELRQNWQARHSVVAGTALTVFVALVIGGYLGSWTWTGFTGNTLWNWMNLLFLPLLLPTVIVPALKPMATGRVVYLDEQGNPVPDPQLEAAAESEDADPPEGGEAVPVRPVPAV